MVGGQRSESISRGGERGGAVSGGKMPDPGSEEGIKCRFLFLFEKRMEEPLFVIGDCLFVKGELRLVLCREEDGIVDC